jgi:hypothetical protein
MLEALAITAAEDLVRDHELVAGQGPVLRVLLGVDVDELHDPVHVASAGGGEEVRHHLSGDAHVLGKGIALP